MIKDRLKEIRKKRNKLQKDVAQAIGLTTAAYSNYEQGRTLPDIQKIKMIADYFDVPTDFLLEREEPNLNEHSIQYVETTELDRLVLKKYKMLDTKTRKAVNSLLEIN